MAVARRRKQRLFRVCGPPNGENLGGLLQVSWKSHARNFREESSIKIQQFGEICPSVLENLGIFGRMDNTDRWQSTEV